jgi:3-deoxy-7-phosphoheptulonate synthase
MPVSEIDFRAVPLRSISTVPLKRDRRSDEVHGMEPTLPELKVLRRCWPGFESAATTHPVLVGGIAIGGALPVIIAGPCAVESFEQTLAVARAVRGAGIGILRGGAFKPRTYPGSFQGLGEEGLEILAEVRRETGLAIVTEVLDPRLVERVAAVADMLQIGSRSMQNTPLLIEAGRSGKPVLLKRGWSATLGEWLGAADYVAREGNHRIVLCERGMRVPASEGYARSVLDLNVIHAIRTLTPLPVLVDPSHSAGRWDRVEPLARAALAASAHGLLIEVVAADADRALLRSDAEQGIPPDVLERIAEFSRLGFTRDSK